MDGISPIIPSIGILLPLAVALFPIGLLALLFLAPLPLLRILPHHVLKLRPQGFYRAELIAHLLPISHLESPAMESRPTAITPSSDRFSLLMFWRTCSRLCAHGNGS